MSTGAATADSGAPGRKDICAHVHGVDNGQWTMSGSIHAPGALAPCASDHHQVRASVPGLHGPSFARTGRSLEGCAGYALPLAPTSTASVSLPKPCLPLCSVRGSLHGSKSSRHASPCVCTITLCARTCYTSSALCDITCHHGTLSSTPAETFTRL